LVQLGKQTSSPDLITISLSPARYAIPRLLIIDTGIDSLLDSVDHYFSWQAIDLCRVVSVLVRELFPLHGEIIATFL
jgi:hypothetical protein